MDTDFFPIHDQSPVADMVFVTLLVAYLLFLVVASMDCLNILRHPVKIDSDKSRNKFYVKSATAIWSKGMILLSVPLMVDILNGLYPLPALTSPIFIVAIGSTMVIRYVIMYSIYSVNHDLNLKLFEYASECRVVIFSVVLVPITLIVYSLKMLLFLPFVIIVLYFIFHIIRSIVLLKDIKFYFADIFLYLCMFEILPLMLTCLSALKILG